MSQQGPVPDPIGPADPSDGRAEALTGKSSREPLASVAALVDAQQEISALRAALVAANERERALTYELQHRVRNMLAVIRSIYRRTREIGASQNEFAEHFEGRFDAMARYHSRVAGPGSTGVDLEDLLRDELLEVQCLDGPGCSLNGAPVQLRHRSAELMALAIHELATNAIKFGAFAQGGQLAVHWSLEDATEGATLRFRWTETGVSVASSAPRPSGFGQQLIEEALPYQLGATTSLEFKPGGIDCLILIPAAELDMSSGVSSDRAG